jgi:outer membrane protein assembly factor BamB
MRIMPRLPTQTTARRTASVLILGTVLTASPMKLSAGDQPQWGQQYSRNLVSDETGLPDSFDPQTGRNIKWSVALGTECYATPIIAGGRVYIGTNNGEPRDPKHQGDRGVLMCLAESDGRFLWQLIVPKRDEDPFFDWPKSGICSPATVEGDRVYLVSNRGEVLCLDAQGMTNGNDGPYTKEGSHMVPPGANPLQPGPTDADIIWLFDLTSGAGIWSHDAAHSSILIHGPYLYLNTGTGVDNTHRTIQTPDAPGLIVLDKATGRYVAREAEKIAPRIFHSTWSAPSLAVINGRPLVFFAGGNGVIYAFAALPFPSPGETALQGQTGSESVLNLKKVWQFDFDPAGPKEDVHRYHLNRREGPSNMYGMPIFHQNRIYVAGGGDIFWGKLEAWLKCIDATQTGDITKTGQVWSYPLQRHTLSTPAVYNGLAFVGDCGRLLHCVDADTGHPYWTHELKGEIWSSPLAADGKVYLGSRRGDFWVLAAAKEKRVLSSVELGSAINGTATVANSVLYVSNMTRLYAVQKEPAAAP